MNKLLRYNKNFYISTLIDIHQEVIETDVAYYIGNTNVENGIGDYIKANILDRVYNVDNLIVFHYLVKYITERYLNSRENTIDAFLTYNYKSIVREFIEYFCTEED